MGTALNKGNGMNKDTSIIICCAGMGTRLGIGTTKALVKIKDKPLIIHQLEQLNEYDDIRIVVGFQAEKVIDLVNSYRKDVMFAFNYDFRTTGTLKSVEKAIIAPRKYTVVLGGDTFIHPGDFSEFLKAEEACIGYSRLRSSEPILMTLDDKDNVIDFSKKNGQVEWSGLVKFRSSSFSNQYQYVYEMLKPMLPIKSMEIRSIDIDTPEDYEKAVKWAESSYSDVMLSKGDMK